MAGNRFGAKLRNLLANRGVVFFVTADAGALVRSQLFLSRHFLFLAALAF